MLLLDQDQPLEHPGTQKQSPLYTLAVALPTFTMPIYTEFLKGVRGHLHRYPVDLLLCDLGTEGVDRWLRRLQVRSGVDGLLLVGMPVDAALSKALQALAIPVVLVGMPSRQFDSFCWDDVLGAAAAVRHLIAEGHRRIGMIVSHEGSFGVRDRMLGYRQALQEAGIPYRRRMLRRGVTAKHRGCSEEAGYEAMEHLLKKPSPVSAVFASNDVLAVGAWKALQDRNLAVPEAVAVVGYGNIKMSRYLDLSSVDQGMRDVGHRATELLLQRIMGTYNRPPIATRIIPRLIIRKTSKIPWQAVR